jgi:hypothetical protein
MLDRNPGKKLSDLKKALPVAYTSLTMSPHCADEEKYGVVDDVVKEYQDLFAAGGSILGRKIKDVITVNGVRVAPGGRLVGAGAGLVQQARDGGGGREPPSPRTTCAPCSARR